MPTLRTSQTNAKAAENAKLTQMLGQIDAHLLSTGTAAQQLHAKTGGAKNKNKKDTARTTEEAIRNIVQGGYKTSKRQEAEVADYTRRYNMDDEAWQELAWEMNCKPWERCEAMDAQRQINAMNLGGDSGDSEGDEDGWDSYDEFDDPRHGVDYMHEQRDWNMNGADYRKLLQSGDLDEATRAINNAGTEIALTEAQIAKKKKENAKRVARRKRQKALKKAEKEASTTEAAGEDNKTLP